jgi:hypothetical protein
VRLVIRAQEDWAIAKECWKLAQATGHSSESGEEWRANRALKG